MYSESTTPDSGRGPWARVLRVPQVGVLAVAVPVAALPAIFAGRGLPRTAQLQHGQEKETDVSMHKLDPGAAGPTARIPRDA
jgi:hypothetical protein